MRSGAIEGIAPPRLMESGKTIKEVEVKRGVCGRDICIGILKLWSILFSNSYCVAADVCRLNVCVTFHAGSRESGSQTNTLPHKTLPIQLDDDTISLLVPLIFNHLYRYKKLLSRNCCRDYTNNLNLLSFLKDLVAN